MRQRSYDLQNPLSIKENCPFEEPPSSWKWKSLNDVAKLESGHTPSRKNASYWGGDISWVSLQDTKSLTSSVIYDTFEHITTEGLANSSARLLPKDTVIFSRTASVGLCCRLGKKMATSQDFANYICGPLLLPAYLVYAFLGTRWDGLVAGSVHNTIYMPDFRRMHLLLPPLLEQRAIVEILDTADAAVRKTEALIKVKTEYKRAVAEELLNGLTVECKEVAIGEMLQEVERPVVWNDDDSYNLVSVKRRSEGLFLRSMTHGRDIKTKNLKQIKAGDFLISKMQVVHGAWATVPDKYDGCHVSGSYISLVPKNTAQLDTLFFGYLSQQPALYSIALKCSHGVHIEKMTFKLGDFFKKKVKIPRTLPEQQRIAECLSLMDEEIRLLQQQGALLKKQKQGLMQRLLTGEVRVPEFRDADDKKNTTVETIHDKADFAAALAQGEG